MRGWDAKFLEEVKMTDKLKVSLMKTMQKVPSTFVDSNWQKSNDRNSTKTNTHFPNQGPKLTLIGLDGWVNELCDLHLSSIMEKLEQVMFVSKNIQTLTQELADQRTNWWNNVEALFTKFTPISSRIALNHWEKKRFKLSPIIWIILTWNRSFSSWTV